jgi:hypothetical protein
MKSWGRSDPRPRCQGLARAHQLVFHVDGQLLRGAHDDAQPERTGTVHEVRTHAPEPVQSTA